MSEHTQGKLECNSAGHGSGSTVVIDEYYVQRPGDDVAVAADIVDPETGKPSEANALRLAACWNACEGITTEALESGSLNNFDLQRDRMVLTQQRDELLAALEEVLRISDRNHDAWARAHAAIAKAKGGAQ